VPKVPKVKGTKMTITCFGPVFIGLKMGFPILSSLSTESRRAQRCDEKVREYSAHVCYAINCG